MTKLKNPFVIGKYVGPKYFCDRVEESKQLIHHVVNGRNVVVMSERRLGKTGLIEHCLASKELCDEYNAFFIDIYALHNLREFVYELANEVFRKIAPKQKNFLEHFSKILKSLKTSFSIDQMSGTPQVSFSLGEIRNPEVTLDEVFECLEKADKPCIVAIDEFQQIVGFEEDNVEALLRTKIQHLKNVQFVFAGSKRHLLEGIFNSPNRPFYNSVVFMRLAPIAETAYLDFCTRHFKSNDKRLDEKLVTEAYRSFGGVTWYLQLFMNEAYAMTPPKKEASLSDFKEVLQHLVDTKRFTFEEIYARLTEKQKILVMAMAAEYPNKVNLTSADFISRYQLKTASAVQSAMKGLMDKGVVDDFGGSRQISDLLFAYWLKMR